MLLRAGLVPLRAYWWLMRPRTLGVKALVAREDGSVLLVRHSYRSGWYLPGGGVKRGESACEAMERELVEEVSVTAKVGPQDVYGVYFSRAEYKSDHVVVFVISEWKQSEVWRRNIEIDEQAFFPADSLPDGVSKATRARIEEFFGLRERHWSWSD